MPTYHHFTDAVGEYRFRLKADNGGVFLASEGYTTKDTARSGALPCMLKAPTRLLSIDLTHNEN